MESSPFEILQASWNFNFDTKIKRWDTNPADFDDDSRFSVLPEGYMENFWKKTEMGFSRRLEALSLVSVLQPMYNEIAVFSFLNWESFSSNPPPKQ